METATAGYVYVEDLNLDLPESTMTVTRDGVSKEVFFNAIEAAEKFYEISDKLEEIGMTLPPDFERVVSFCFADVLADVYKIFEESEDEFYQELFDVIDGNMVAEEFYDKWLSAPDYWNS